MKTKFANPRLVVIETRQERQDLDYGSCLWARFCFNLDNYELTVTSDCGSYAYGWIPTPDSESFLALMSRIDKDYLLEKIAEKSVVDTEPTFNNVIQYLTDLCDGDPDMLEELHGKYLSAELHSACEYSSESFCREGLKEAVSYTSFDDADLGYSEDDLYDCIELVEPIGARRVADIFERYIQPTIAKEKVR